MNTKEMMVDGIGITGIVAEADEKVDHVAVVELVRRRVQGLAGRERVVEAGVRSCLCYVAGRCGCHYSGEQTVLIISIVQLKVT